MYLDVNEAGRQIDVELISRAHKGRISAPPFERQELLNSTRRLLESKRL
ncbi:15036_t:CDS:2 [Cetraspora pellucida]|uniref:15036_t:CDS:1 n=1 Tax=Cetraspora pellucida TaxID=1433469 RepID=A0A9N9F0K5_9GLOM|nr:15036_t:CDS:2 [Cetraspora pellucida]